MLTVKHRHNDGTETIYEAVSVVRETTGEPTIPPCGDIIIHGVVEAATGKDTPFSPYAGPGTCHEGDGKVRISPKWMDPKGFDESRVFIMNRFGVTVEQHRFFLTVGTAA